MIEVEGILWGLFFLAIGVLISIFTPKIRGWLGEKTVANSLEGLPQDKYKIINNVMLRTERGISQIDHIVVSVYGIFVIETKNYSGQITGGENSEQWTKNVYGNKYSFRNPLRQNFGHVKALEGLLGLPEEMFIPIIAFSEEAELKVKTGKPVVYMSDLVKTIEAFSEEKIAESDLNDLAEKIINANVDSKETRKEHVTEIRRKMDEDKKKAEMGICPRCGGKLVERNGKYGTFLGCSNYPKCRYTQEMNDR